MTAIHSPLTPLIKGFGVEWGSHNGLSTLRDACKKETELVNAVATSSPIPKLPCQVSLFLRSTFLSFSRTLHTLSLVTR